MSGMEPLWPGQLEVRTKKKKKDGREQFLQWKLIVESKLNSVEVYIGTSPMEVNS